MSISQSIDAPINTRDNINLSGNLSSHNGNGSGGFMISGRRLINKGWLELDVGAGGGPVFSARGSRNLTNKVYCTGETTLNFRKNGIIPGLVGSESTTYTNTISSVRTAYVYVQLTYTSIDYCSSGRATRQTYSWLPNLQRWRSIVDVNNIGAQHEPASFGVDLFHWYSALFRFSQLHA